MAALEGNALMTWWMLWAFALGFCCGGAALTQHWMKREAQRTRLAAQPMRVSTRVARCAPETQTPASRVQVAGALETYSHPEADRILTQRQLWAPGGNG